MCIMLTKLTHTHLQKLDTVMSFTKRHKLDTNREAPGVMFVLLRYARARSLAWCALLDAHTHRASSRRSTQLWHPSVRRKMPTPPPLPEADVFVVMHACIRSKAWWYISRHTLAKAHAQRHTRTVVVCSMCKHQQWIILDINTVQVVHTRTTRTEKSEQQHVAPLNRMCGTEIYVGFQ